jgi:hypothetical protein
VEEAADRLMAEVAAAHPAEAARVAAAMEAVKEAKAQAVAEKVAKEGAAAMRVMAVVMAAKPVGLHQAMAIRHPDNTERSNEP